MRFLLFLLFWCATSNASQPTTSVAEVEDLKLVQIVFRHGQRGPLYKYKTDPYSEQFDTYWPNGLGITQRGREQLFQLGTFLRHRYDKFLNSSKGSLEVWIRSLGLDRTIQSAEGFSAGMFPPKAFMMWDDQLGKVWQPVTIFSAPFNTEDVVSLNYPCPAHDKLIADTFTDLPDATLLYNKNRDFFDFVFSATGESPTTLKDKWMTIYHIRDVIFCQNANGMKLPSWVNETVFDRVNHLSGLVFGFLYGANGDVARAKWAGGHLLALMENSMRAAIVNNTVPNPSTGAGNMKMLVYAASDLNIAGLLASLKLYNYSDPTTFLGIPAFASVIIVELFQNNSVRISLKNDPAKIVTPENIATLEPTVLTHPDCSTFCPFDKFVEVTKDYLIADYAALCKSQ